MSKNVLIKDCPYCATEHFEQWAEWNRLLLEELSIYELSVKGIMARKHMMLGEGKNPDSQLYENLIELAISREDYWEFLRN